MKWRAVGGFVVTAAVGLACSAVGLPPINAAENPSNIVIWADPAHATALTTMFANGFEGRTVVVVAKDAALIRVDLANAPVDTAPDLIWSDSTSTGELVSAGLVIPLTIKPKAAAEFRTATLDAFRVASSTYGVPVEVSNVALIRNKALVPTTPTTFAEVSSAALALKAAKKVRVPFAVPLGAGTDGYAAYPLFSGLGGYFFGRSADGSFDSSNLGLANKAFLRNSVAIDGWNASGLISGSLTPDAARKAFVRGKSPFWLAGPEEMATLLSLGFVYSISPVPPIVPGLATAPLLRVSGVMVTTFAGKHGVRIPAVKMATQYLTTAPAQLSLAGAAGLIPASASAVAQVSEPRLKAFDLAGRQGVAIPNIPQMLDVWRPYGDAWLASTSGPAAPTARASFTAAQVAVTTAFGQ